MISRVEDGQDRQGMPGDGPGHGLVWYKVAHWQRESLDFSTWISPLPGENAFVMYFLFIDFGFPLCQCVIT